MRKLFTTRPLAWLMAMLLLGPMSAWAQALTQTDFNGLIVPQYMTNGSATRLPVLFRATVTNLTASTLYRGYVLGATNTTAGGATQDFGGATTTNNSGAGIPLLITPTATGATYTTASTGSLTTAGSYFTFTTDATGAYTGWFGFLNSGNARYTTGNLVFPSITLAKDATPATVEKRLALNQSITVLAIGTNGTGIQGSSSATAGNAIALYDNTAGTGRPVSTTVVENIGTTLASVAAFYSTAAGTWNTVIPNANASGVRRVEERSIVTGNVLNCNTDADGVWPSGANTVNPSGGLTPVVLTTTDAPLNAGCNTASTPAVTATPATLNAFSAVQGTPSATQTITVGGSGLTTGVVVTAPAGYEVSLSATTGFAASVTVPQTGGTAASTPVYVRLTAAATGTFAGNVAVTTTGVATATNVAVTGTVTSVAPSAPTITSFSPTTGAAGTTVTITGTNLTGASGVTLNGVAITGFTVVNGTTITFTLPAGATTGALAVTTTGGTATSTGTFTVTTATPTLTSFTPTTGATGATVTLTGTNFTGATAVTVGGVAITGFTVVNATTITFALPSAAVSGPIAVTTPGGTATSTASFTVTTATPAPTITSFTPTTGTAGATVTVTGTNFTGATAVTVGGAAVTAFTVVNATTITFTVPTTATTGPVIVTTPGGTVTSTTSFTLTPATAAPIITGFSPARAVAGAGFTLTVNGSNLVAGTTISFNGNTYTGTILGSGGTGYTVVIPASGVPAVGTYNITATNAGGTSAPLSFMVVAPATSQAYEDFEQGTKSGYATGTVSLRSGDWTFTDALIGDLFNDRVNQVKSARIRAGSIAMNFDKPNGAGVVTLQASLYGSDTGVSFTLEVSTDGGATYTQVAGAPTTLTNTLTPYSFTVNRSGNVRLRIARTASTGTTTPRINIDDINIADFIGTATRASQALAGLALYPNPVHDRLLVALPKAGAAQVLLRDLTGRTVLPLAPLASGGQLELPASLAAGVYLLEVRQGGETAIRRVTKE